MRGRNLLGVFGVLVLLAGCVASQQATVAPGPAPVVAAPAPTAARGTPAPERFANADQAPWRKVEEAPVAMVSLAAYTSSYTVAKRLIGQGVMPHPAMVRPEEFLN
jgi:Ca-activated chloride channel homolog